MSMALAVIILLLCGALSHAETPANSAVLEVFKQTDAGLTHFDLMQRTSVTKDLDLVIAMGSLKTYGGATIGLFLQEKTHPGRVYSLGVKAGFEECSARVERVTATDSVISCEGEKSERYPHQKWVYDVRAKRLIGQFSYQPFAMYRIFPSGTGAVIVGSDTQKLVAVRFTPGNDPEFRILSAAESPAWFQRVQVSEGTVGIGRKQVLRVEPEPFQSLRFGPSGSFQLIRQDGAEGVLTIEEQSGNQIQPYPLPQSTYDEFAAARPQRVANGYVRNGTKIDERIGPWKLEGGQFWFGKTFYDGEGNTGVGGFGYFSAADRTYHLFAPPEVKGWSVSAIDVGPNAVWMALVENGEYGGSSGGLLRYDRRSGAVRQFELPDIGVQFIRAGGKTLAATDFGIAVVEGRRVKRYFIDRTTDGRLRVASATR